MYQDVLSSLFAKHYKLEATVDRKDGGAFVPGDIGGIYDRMILEFYRHSKQGANLMSSWRKRIEQETSIVEVKRGSGPKEKFNTEKLPELKWGQAVDYFKLGQEETATMQLTAILKDNLKHPKASQWIGELTSLLKREDPDQIAQNSTKSGAKRGGPIFEPVPVPEPEPVPQPATAQTPPPAPSPAPAPASTPAPPAPAKDPKTPEKLVDPTKAPPERLVDPTKETN